MKQFLDKDQTAKLIELGFPKPQGWGNKDISNGMSIALYNDGREDFNYSIGELIEFLPKTIKWEEAVYSRVIDVECIAYYSWDYEVYFGSDLIFEEKELINSLFRACVTLKEEGVI